MGGVALGIGIVFTMHSSSLTRATQLPPWWVFGVAFVAVELVAHIGLSARRRPTFYSGNG